MPQVVAWKEILPVGEHATESSRPTDRGKTACGVSMRIENVSPGRLKHPSLVDAVVIALVQFLQSEQGRAIVGRYSEFDDPNALWADPCLPWTLRGFLQKHKVMSLMIPAMEEAKSACRRMRQERGD